jgi:hypothetical protein
VGHTLSCSAIPKGSVHDGKSTLAFGWSIHHP